MKQDSLESARDEMEDHAIRPLIDRLNELGKLDVETDDCEIQWFGIDVARGDT